MFAISLCVLIIVCISDGSEAFQDLSVAQSKGRWEGILEGPLGIFKRYSYVTKTPLGLPKLSSDQDKRQDPKLLTSKNPSSYWDWREKGMVTPVKDQVNCSACWAFVVVAAVESHRLIHLNKNELLSEQFLIDCLFNGEKSNGGCGDASILQTYTEIIFKFGGLLRDMDYRKYSAKQMTCDYQVPKTHNPPVSIYGFRRVDAYNFNEEIMERHLYTDGPLVARINSASMSRYKGGIDEPTIGDCDPALKSMDHAVLIVGYSSYVSKDRVLPYWIIKNSWGLHWGMDGYYYLVRGKNACGITNDVSIPIVSP